MRALVARRWRWYLLLTLIIGGFFLFLRNGLTVRYMLSDAMEEYKGRLGEAVRLRTSTPAPTQAPTRAMVLKSILNCKDRSLRRETVQYGEYWVQRNFMRGSFSTNIGCGESITYTTNGDYTFFDSLAAVAKRWLAPISFAIYAPGYDMNKTLDSIQYIRNCVPESGLIRHYVSFHVFFPVGHMPDYLPLSEDEIMDWEYDCNLTKAPYEDVERSSLYRSEANLTYPINVGRNIARKAANTYFIFASDIELLPSLDLVDQFLNMVLRNTSIVLSNKIPRVFPMPVFELEADASIPDYKTDLLKLLKTKKAIPFHSKICKSCHLVPNQTQWLNASDTNELSVFSVGLRERKFGGWEPFYISDNREPMFDERVTWEGQSNKRIQGLAMCLLGYEYHVLHPAFLVHKPGIKKFDKKSPRLKYVRAMNKMINLVIRPEYKILYGDNRRCHV